jgi:REP element-mobilizing transposase RayT
MSRIIERRHIFGQREKEKFLALMRNLADFSGLEVLTYALLDNHWHALIYVPEPRVLSDGELLERLRYLYTQEQVELVAKQIQEFRQQGQHEAADAVKARFTYRMYSISEYFKALKQRFSQFYNTREERSGPLWEQRFKSVLVERSENALRTMAAYIDLNPVRAGLVSDPKDYRYSGYGEAVGGGKEARRGLRRLMEATHGSGRVSWGKTHNAYRQHLYVQGRQKGQNRQGQAVRPGFTPEQVRQVLAAGGRLPMHEILRCRVRYFSDGLALGSREFLEKIFQRYRGHFGPRRETGARPMRFADWGELCTLRSPRLLVVTRC